MSTETRKVWTFDWSWRAKSPVTGRWADYAETIELDAGRDAAERAHKQACQGVWLRPGWRRPYVGPLIEWEVPAESDERSSGLSRAIRLAEVRPAVEIDPIPHPADIAATA